VFGPGAPSARAAAECRLTLEGLAPVDRNLLLIDIDIRLL